MLPHALHNRHANAWTAVDRNASSRPLPLGKVFGAQDAQLPMQSPRSVLLCPQVEAPSSPHMDQLVTDPATLKTYEFIVLR